MTKTARSLKIFDIPLGPGGKRHRLYDQQQRLEEERELFQGPRGLKIANAFSNLTETQQKMRYEMLLESKGEKDRKEINMMWEKINKEQEGVNKNTSTPQNPLWGNPEPKKRDTPLW